MGLKKDPALMALWAAVVFQALKDTESRDPNTRLRVLQWFRDKTSDAPGSMLHVCSALDLDPRAVTMRAERGVSVKGRYIHVIRRKGNER